ncbi:hypothetical protein [Paracoccus pantotrophus]|uniref:hypothetical protein n=1 Tax=Paracoccus pantotrophus TaxID=82367 RepID=UPI001E44C942|nr:hypothetical protein [Paracoccus pantotrophus]
MARRFQQARGILQQPRDQGLVGRDEGGKNIVHLCQPAPFVAGQQLDPVLASLGLGTVVTQPEFQLPDLRLVQPGKDRGIQRRFQIRQIDLASRRDAVDTPCLVPQDRRCRGKVQGNGRGRLIAGIGDPQPPQDRNAVLRRGEIHLAGQQGGKLQLRPESDR